MQYITSLIGLSSKVTSTVLQPPSTWEFEENTTQAHGSGFKIRSKLEYFHFAIFFTSQLQKLYFQPENT